MIHQIVSAYGWAAVIRRPEGRTELWPIACWALEEVRGEVIVVGMVNNMAGNSIELKPIDKALVHCRGFEFQRYEQFKFDDSDPEDMFNAEDDR